MHQGRTSFAIAVGEIDLATVGGLRSATHRWTRGEIDSLVVDLTAVTFIDSSGLHALLDAHRNAMRLGVHMVVITTPDSPVDSTLRLSMLDEVLPVAYEAPGPT